MGETQRVERWALVRLDLERDMLRLEICRATEQGAGALASMANPRSRVRRPQAEDLGWWDMDETTAREMTRTGFLRLFKLGADTDLAEGMVFYVFKPGGEGTDKVVDATILARELAKAMYNELLDIPAKTKAKAQTRGGRR